MKPIDHSYFPLNMYYSTEPTPKRDRSTIPEHYKWNLSDLYPNDESWRSEKQRIANEMKVLEKYRGKLASARDLLACLDVSNGIAKELSRLHAYASMASDQDTRDSVHLAMLQELTQLYADFSVKASYIEPEILRIGKNIVERFFSQEKGLEVYRHYLDDVLRRQPHTGTEGEEKIIADATLIADGPENIHSIFANADFPYPDITLSDGKTVRLDQAAFSLHRASANRDDRKKVFAAFFGKVKEFRRTYGTQLYAEVKKNMFFSRARKYGSCLESALDANNIPVAVYHNLINNVRANLNTFHRYLKLRKRILGVDELHYYDLYAPLVKGVDLKYSVEEAQANIIESLAPLGEEYIAVAKRAFSERWVDFFPSEGKRSGGYSNGSAYDVHPYMLLNYNGKYDDMSTLTHELGHAMHSYFSNKTQPYPTSRYAIFVAEVASTFNESLLIDHMLKKIKDDGVRLSLLGNYLEGFKGTVFRQTQFSEFELRIHEIAERGESLTGDSLCALYEQIIKEYYGHEERVCVIDDEIGVEWAYIPHFFYSFYVYQYATSFTASCALSERVLAGDGSITKQYLDFLSAGGSDYPINILKKAGVDMTTPEPFDFTMKKMNRIMDEMEEILKKVPA
jgi:oligoendopeptidase F